jgi:hypothetical protein
MCERTEKVKVKVNINYPCALREGMQRDVMVQLLILGSMRED